MAAFMWECHPGYGSRPASEDLCYGRLREPTPITGARACRARHLI